MLEQYFRVNQAVGIGIHLGSGDQATINACSISVESNKLTFDKKIANIAGVNQLKNDFTLKFAALNLTGRGILQKRTELIEHIDQQSFGAVFPNVKIDDFYVQNFKSGKYSFISIIRKNDADKWLELLNNSGYEILALTLGAFPIQNVISQLNIYDTSFAFDGHNIERNDAGEWVSVSFDKEKKAPFLIKAESEIINEQLLLAYASAFQLLLNDKIDPVHAEVPRLNQKLNDVLDTKRLKVYGSIILALFFLLLLINFVVFSGLNQSNNRLSEQVSSTDQNTSGLQQLNDQVKQKEQLLNILGWDNGLNKTSFIDQIASLLPSDITLDEITVNPIDNEKSRVAKSLSFYNREIRVKGYSASIIPVNEWIARIKTKSWVKDIQLESYTFNSEKNTGQFIINIQY